MISLTPLGEDSPPPPPSFLQAAFWAVFKTRFGWNSAAFAFEFVVREGAAPSKGGLRVMWRRLRGPLCFAYVAGGPSLEDRPADPTTLLAELARSLRSRLPRGCLFVRFDCPWYEVEEGGSASEDASSPDASAPPRRPVFRSPLRKARSDVQPPDSTILDLGRSEEEILAGMKSKWRYNIRLAEKKGVIVSEEGRSGLDSFFGLYEETSRRDRIAIHPRAYYESLFEVADQAFGGERPDLRLWVARFEGEALAAIITLFYQGSATYLYGASSDSRRSLMPAYALQWSAIRAARSAGCSSYDFYGIPPRDDPDHPMGGLYRFKTGFGGKLVHYAGSWDFAYRPFLYGFWTLAETLRSFWYKVALKRLARRKEVERPEKSGS
jgi:lipid II:glycine glycyltransferase (peptidoglycan interpeptide bridge formation enzyme)